MANRRLFMIQEIPLRARGHTSVGSLPEAIRIIFGTNRTAYSFFCVGPTRLSAAKAI
ncbi:hypothetical protein QWZ16_03725 [Vibrio ostreicida]|uniref:DUF3265 domain-containing protein n=1 Tax=Vibrio ostreicida TaxID=526588 RepID=A0ABT8BPN8_9VIBR|nr:hypothetical protein [Vibrio ostreicida]MDN3608851.1 hypothetical protein [Vibrio ostreicida]